MSITEIRPQTGPQELFLSTSADIAIYGGSAGGGKLLSLDTPIPTPTGWTTVGQVKVGDEVFDENGQPTLVLALSAIDLAPESYRLIFDDHSVIDACADHLWVTMTATDLDALSRRTPEWRAARRARRPSRVGGKKSALFTEAIIARNRESNQPPTLPPPTGSVRTTREIAETLIAPSGRANHAIPVAAPLDLKPADLPLDGYCLGQWLGDGHSNGGAITTADPETVTAFQDAGFVVAKWKSTIYTYGIYGLVGILRRLGVLGNKHVPLQYQRASVEQRLAVLQGLMDSDGYVSRTGALEFTTTSAQLASGVYDLATGLGHKVGLSRGRATLNGRYISPKWRLKWTSDLPMFRLPRKVSRQRPVQRRTTQFRYVKQCDRIPSTPMRCLTVNSPSHLFLAGRALIPTHNSFGLLLDPLRYVKVPGFDAVIFRRTSPELTNAGGLWPSSYRIYPIMKHRDQKPIPNKSDLKWTFPPHGTSIRFAHMEHEDTHLTWRSSEVAMIGFDELTSFTEEQFFYMLSRNRSTCGVRPYIRAGTNPDADSWVADLVAWWINQETGYPIPERAGVLRWMIRPDEALVWADTKEELLAHYPQSRPKSMTFIPANVHDNTILLAKDPEYLANLQLLLPVERERLLGGNWKIRPSAGLIFSRESFRIVQGPPMGQVIGRKRYWDKASTEGRGDYTAGVLISRMVDGQFCVEDVVRGQWSSLVRDQIMKQTAIRDGVSTQIWVEQEPGSSGVDSAAASVRNLVGWDVRTDRVTGDKMARAAPFARQVQGANVMVVQAPWTRAFIDEHHGFPTGKHDDQVDAASGAFNKLAGAIVIDDFDPAELDGQISDSELGGSFLD